MVVFFTDFSVFLVIFDGLLMMTGLQRCRLLLLMLSGHVWRAILTDSTVTIRHDWATELSITIQWILCVIAKKVRYHITFSFHFNLAATSEPIESNFLYFNICMVWLFIISTWTRSEILADCLPPLECTELLLVYPLSPCDSPHLPCYPKCRTEVFGRQ